MRIILILLILTCVNLFSYNKKIVKTTIRSAAEEIITKSGFSLLNKAIQEEAIKEQAQESKHDDCIDDSCLMDTGKMLAAQRLFLIRISEMGNDNYMFKISDVNLETNENVAVFSEVYTGNLGDVNKLFEFSKKFLNGLLKGNKKRVKKIDSEKLPVMLEIVFDLKTSNESDNVKKYFLSIKSKYDPVNVYNQRKYLGTTPLKLLVKEGMYSLTFEKEGFALAESKIIVNKDSEVRNIPFILAKTLLIKSKLNGATIYLNNKDYGEIKDNELKLKLPKGEYKLVINKNGYEEKTKNITLKNDLTIDFGKMYKKGGPYPVKIKTNIKSRLFINGKFKGYSPLEVKLKSGIYKLNIKNSIVGNEEHMISVKKSEYFNFKANKGFFYLKTGVNIIYLYTNFDFQRNENHFLTGFDLSLFNWSWKYLNLDILGFGFYAGLNSDKMFKFHLLGVDLKLFSDFIMSISLGPLGEDYLNLYDNTQDSYMSFGGVNLKYSKNFFKNFSFYTDVNLYYGCKNSIDSFFDSEDNSMENGIIFFATIGVKAIY